MCSKTLAGRRHNVGRPNSARGPRVEITVLNSLYATAWATQICRNVEAAVGQSPLRGLSHSSIATATTVTALLATIL